MKLLITILHCNIYLASKLFSFVDIIILMKMQALIVSSFQVQLFKLLRRENYAVYFVEICTVNWRQINSN